MSLEQFNIEEIRSPDRMVRLFALEQTIQEGDSPLVLQELQARKDLEEDEECRIMIEHAIQALQMRISEERAPRSSVENPAEFEEAFGKGDLAEKTRLLSSLSESQTKKIAAVGPALLSKETIPFLEAFLLRRFGSCWPKDELPRLLQKMESPSRSVHLAAFRTLLHLAPKELEKHLPRFLASPDFRLKSLALQGLVKIDPEEAISHLEALLLSRHPASQMVALANGVHVSFDRFQEPLLKLFVIEDNLDILKTAGDFFVINPDARIPFKLLEIAAQAKGEKVQLIQGIMVECGKAIRDSGILKGEFSVFWAGLTSAVAEKTRQKTVRELLGRLETEEVSLALVGRFQKSLEKDALLKAAFEKMLAGPLAEPVRVSLQALLKGQPSALEKKAVPVSCQALLEMALPEQLQVVARLSESKDETSEALLKKIADEPRSSAELLVAVLQAADELNLASLVPQAEKFLARSEETLVVQSLMYLGRFEFEAIFPRLGALLNSEKPYVSVTVKKIISRYDPVRAIRAIQLLLQKPNQRETALQWMLMIDFSLIRDVLTEFLAEPIPDADFESGLLIFQVNPDPGNLYALFRLQKTVPGGRKDAVQKISKETLTTLRELQIVSEERCQALEAEFQKRFTEDQHRQSLPVPAYSVKSIAKKEIPQDAHWIDFSGWTSRIMAVGVLLCIGVGGIVWMVQTPGSFRPHPSAKNAASGKTIAFTDHRPTGVSTDKTGKRHPLDQTLFDAPAAAVKEFLKADQRRADLFGETSRLLKGAKK